jgi:hypothetical protein
VDRRPQRSHGPAAPDRAAPAAPDEPDIDEILAKISREGLQALTDEERARLAAARAAKLRRPNR